MDAALLAAHAAGDGGRLVALYAEAAERALVETGDGVDGVEAAAFYLTHAYVFALETGHPMAGPLHARLKALGREE